MKACHLDLLKHSVKSRQLLTMEVIAKNVNLVSSAHVGTASGFSMHLEHPSAKQFKG